MSVLSNPENTTNAPTNCTNNGEVSVLEGTNGFGQDVYRCRGISHLFGGGLYDTWLGRYLQDQDTQDIDRIFRQEEAEAFKELLEGLENGTKTWRDLEEFELDFLAEIPEMVEYYDTLYSQVQINGFYEELENAETDLDRSAVLDEFINAGIKTNPLILRDLEENDTDWDGYYQGILDGFSDSSEDPETTFEDVVEDLGEGIANTAKGIVDEWSDKITDCAGNPVDCIKKVGEALLEAGGVPDYCTDGTMTDPFFCTEKGPDDGGKVCWKDCVTGNLPGIPGLNIPLPPGVIDVGTYRDLENSVKTVGKTIGDIIDGNESCGPDGKQECTVGQVLEDLGTWAKEKWEEVFEGVDDATGEDVLDWLKGILGPATAGIIWGEIEEEVTNILIPVDAVMVDCKDANGVVYATVEEGKEDCPEPPAVDCNTSQFGCCEDGVTAKTDSEGTNCEEYAPNGFCEDGVTPKTDSEGTNCEEYAPNGFCEDDVTPKTDPAGTNCEEYEPPPTAEEEECDKQGRVWNTTLLECEENCTIREHVVLADGNCGPPEEPTICTNNATIESGCEKCADGSLPSQHQNGDCNQPEVITQVECPKNTPKAGQMVDKLSECGEPTNATGFDCTQPRPSGFSFGTVAWNQNCETTHCTDGTLKDNAEGTNCPGYVPPEVTGPEPTPDNCDQQDRVTREDGSCGECKPGFIEDPQGFDQCIQAPPECNDCSCPEYAAENPSECTQCPEGEAYCEATGTCTTPEECPGGPTGGGGGGGGGGSMFEFDLGEFGIKGDPQLLDRPRFGTQDFLTPLFAESRGAQSSFPIAQFLANKKGKI